MRPSDPRPTEVGPASGPQAPFPLRLSGPIVKGFGRGSADLGIPTANIPIEGLAVGGHTDVESGVYYGWAGLTVDATGRKIVQGEHDAGITLWPMVMSIGWNPFYKNTVRSVEVHIMHEFAEDFYGAWMNLLIVGYIRPEYDYVSKESLIEDIRFDISVARNSLARPAYSKLKTDSGLLRTPDSNEMTGKA